jgi:hypothetical protein
MVHKSVDASSLAEVIDRIITKGIIVDIYPRVPLLGIELLTIDTRICIMCVETWLKFAEAVGLTKEAEAV